eukprot:1185394-Prorocentrum_minimum.AAC.1
MSYTTSDQEIQSTSGTHAILSAMKCTYDLYPDLDTQLNFCRCMEVLSLKKGQVICKQGDPPNGFFVILTGKVAIKGKYGETSFATSLNQGKTFGDL